MSFGTDFQKVIETLIEGRLGSTLTRTKIVRSNAGYGGYEGEVEVEGTTSTVYCIPSRYLKDSRIKEYAFGDIDEGEVALLIKGSQAMDQDDKITFEGVDYRIKAIEPIELNGTVIAKRLILFKKRT